MTWGRVSEGHSWAVGWHHGPSHTLPSIGFVRTRPSDQGCPNPFLYKISAFVSEASRHLPTLGNLVCRVFLCHQHIAAEVSMRVFGVVISWSDRKHHIGRRVCLLCDEPRDFSALKQNRLESSSRCMISRFLFQYGLFVRAGFAAATRRVV